MKTLDILTVELVEWLDNPFKRSQISDKDLAESIEQVGVKQPLAAIKKDGRYLIVDGNRRLRIAGKLNIKQLPVNIYDDEDPVKLAIILNTTGKGWDQQTLGQLVASHPEALSVVPRRYSGKIQGIMTLMGDDFKHFITNYSPNAYDEGMRAAAYVSRKDNKEFCKKAAFWVGKHKMTRHIRNAIGYNIASPADIEKAIMDDKPLIMRITLE